MASRATVDELIRVLAYPKFRLTADDQEAVLADFLPFAQTVRNVSAGSRLPVLRDSADEPFLALAVSASADALVTGDGSEIADFPILTAAESRKY